MFKFVVKRNSKELFHRAVLDNDVFRVKMLLEHIKGDPKFQIDEINDDGLTALQFSCFSGNLDLVKTLVFHGANMKIKDRDGWSLLHGAAMAGNVEIAKFLIESGAKLVTRNDNGDLPIDVADELPMTVLLLKSMLEQGFHREVNSYMRKHPHLKKKISREIDAAIKQKKDEIRALEKLPYTSHYDRKRNSRSSEFFQDFNVNNSPESYSGTYFLLSRPNSDDVARHQGEIRNSNHLQVSQSFSRRRTETYYDRELDDTSLSGLRKSSSATDLFRTQTDENFNVCASKVVMHNGYDTDETHTSNYRRSFIRQDSAPEISIPFQTRAVEFRELSGINSTSSSGYETDEVEGAYSQHYNAANRPQLNFIPPVDPISGPVQSSDPLRSVKDQRRLHSPTATNMGTLQYVQYPEILL